MRGFAKTLVTTGVLLLCGAAAHAQSTPPEPHASCAAISQSDAQLEPLSKLCEFALAYRRSLPNFICEQKTVSRAHWLGGPQTMVMEAQVTYRNGVEQYSNVLINGKPGAVNAGPGAFTFQTAGEFGNELVDLFENSGRVQFGHAKSTRIQGKDAIEVSFHIKKEQNSFWSIGDGFTKIFPEFKGTIAVTRADARLLRESLTPVGLPDDFHLESAEKTTDYGDVNLGEAGVHVLPVKAQSRGCMRVPSVRRITPPPRCITNTLEFHGCRKFGAKARIVP